MKRACTIFGAVFQNQSKVNGDASKNYPSYMSAVEAVTAFPGSQVIAKPHLGLNNDLSGTIPRHQLGLYLGTPGWASGSTLKGRSMASTDSIGFDTFCVSIDPLVSKKVRSVYGINTGLYFDDVETVWSDAMAAAASSTLLLGHFRFGTNAFVVKGGWGLFGIYSGFKSIAEMTDIVGRVQARMGQRGISVT